MGRMAALALLGALALDPPAAADTVDDCVQGEDLELQRGACTALIAVGGEENISWAYYNRAYANYHLGEPEQAIRDLDEAIAIDPDYGKAYGLRCSAHIVLDQFGAALADCGRDIALRPDRPTAYYNRALIHCRLGDLESAVADMQSEWALGPDVVVTDQQMLSRLGFYDGPISGTVDEATMAALHAWIDTGC